MKAAHLEGFNITEIRIFNDLCIAAEHTHKFIMEYNNSRNSNVEASHDDMLMASALIAATQRMKDTYNIVSILYTNMFCCWINNSIARF